METKPGGKPKILIFDEPSTGLSDHDVKRLLIQLRELRNLGHTLIVVEHHLGLLSSCDFLVEIGPGPADAGGEIIFSGQPKDISQQARSLTAPYLKNLFQTHA